MIIKSIQTEPYQKTDKDLDSKSLMDFLTAEPVHLPDREYDWIFTGVRGRLLFNCYLKLEALKIIGNTDPLLITRLGDMIKSRDSESVDLAAAIMDEILSIPK